MSICNIFKPYSSGSQIFMFSDYTNDITSVINNDGQCSVQPSKFVCLNLSLTDKTKLQKSIQGYYEHLACVARDANTEDKSYLNYLYGGLISKLVREGFVGSSSSNIYTISKVAINDIDVMSDSTIDGMNYDEIICWLGPNDTNKYEIKVDETTEDCKIITTTSTYIQGYDNEEHRTITGVDYTRDEVSKTSFNFFKAEEGEINTTDDSFIFNSILVLYDIKYGDTTKYTNIPMCLYITDNPVVKYNNNTEIYGQGTSYSLRISMRFASTIDGTMFLSADALLDPSYQTAVQMLDKMNDTIDKFNEMSNSFKDYADMVKDYANLVASTDETNGKIYWRKFIQG